MSISLEMSQIIILSISTIIALIALIISTINIRLIKKGQKYSCDITLYQTVTTELDQIISDFKKENNKHLCNDKLLWEKTAMQMADLHHMILVLEDSILKKSYFCKLRGHILTLQNIFNRIDDFKFFYGQTNYTNQSSEDLAHIAYYSYSDIFSDALLTFAQFFRLFHGMKLTYMFDDEELNKIFRIILVGDYENILAELQSFTSGPMLHIVNYTNEWSKHAQRIYEQGGRR